MEAQAAANVDVSDVIKVHVDYGKLSLVLTSILSRLDALEIKPQTESHTEPPKTVEPEPQQRSPLPEATKDSGPEIADLTAKLQDHEARLLKIEDEVRANAERDRLSAVTEAPLASGTPVQKTLAQAPQAVDESRIASLEDEVKQLKDILAALEDRVNVEHRTKAVKPVPTQDGVVQKDFQPQIDDLTQRVEAAVAEIDAARVLLNAKPASEHTESAADLRGRLEQLEAQPRGTPLASDFEARLAALEQRINVLPTGHADFSEIDGLKADVARLKDAVEVGRQSDRDGDRALSDALADVRAKIDATNDAVNVLKSQIGAMTTPSSDGSSGVSDAQFNLLRGSVDGLQANQKTLRSEVAEQLAKMGSQIADLDSKLKDSAGAKDMQRLQIDLASLEKAVGQLRDQLNSEVKSLRDATRGLDDSVSRLNSTKANKTDIPVARDGVSREAVDARFDELLRIISAHESKIADFGKTPGPPVQSLPGSQSLAPKIAELELRLRNLEQVDANALAAAARDVDQRVSEIAAAMSRDRDWASQQVVEIRATIDHVHHTKADTAQVANKAERDYVENALEKLMREVEQVMNTTNAGLIDTLDKSLGILRDMIDGKASKSDLAKSRALAHDDVGVVPEGLTGYKSYRCLGCNRTVDAMRTRPMGANFSNFMNRLPTSPRQPPRTAEEGIRRPAGLIAASPS